MRFNDHSNLAGQHAFLSASNYHWMNYDEEKLDRVYVARLAAARGTELHALGHDLIRLGVKLPSSKKTLNMYVNDGIGYNMESEVMLYYSDNAFGTPDTCSFRRNKLRIHDLKTGVIEASVHQLEVYAALFCLEYRYKPFEIEIEMRIYQNDEVRIFAADPDVITHIMSTIIAFDKRINVIREEES